MFFLWNETIYILIHFYWHFLFCDQGPFGERDDQQVFIQKVVPITNKLFVRLSSTGKRWHFTDIYIQKSLLPYEMYAIEVSLCDERKTYSLSQDGLNFNLRVCLVLLLWDLFKVLTNADTLRKDKG